jgi:molybdopterin adenylyltransferase
MPAARILVVSTGVAAGTREDRGGPALVAALAEAGWDVGDTVIVPDGIDAVATGLRRICDRFAGLVVTTGGTGFSPTDRTPEGTRAVIDREAPGLAEAMRAVDPRGRHGRGVSGTVGSALVVNCPGSPGGAVDQLTAILDVLPHAVALLADQPTSH